MKTFKIKFNQQTINVIEDENGERWLPLRTLCKNLQLSSQKQQNRIEKDPSLKGNHMVTVAPDNKTRKVYCLFMDHLQGWLFLINPNKVKPFAKPALLKYRKECLTALNNYFTKGVALKEDLTKDRKIKILENELNKLTPSATKYDKIVDVGNGKVMLTVAYKAAGIRNGTLGNKLLINLGILKRDKWDNVVPVPGKPETFGWFTTREGKYYLQTMVTPKGVEGIKELAKNLQKTFMMD